MGLVLLIGLGASVPTAVAAPPRAVADASQPVSRVTDTTGAAADPAGAVTEDAAIAQAAQTGESVEVTALRSESTETYALPNGHLQDVEHVRPVRTRVDGQWQPIDTGLVQRADGSVGPKVAALDVAFSGGGSAQPLITLQRAGRELSLSWPDPLPVPVIDGSTATYANVLPDVDLQVRADADSASEVLVVKTAQAAENPQLAELRLAVGSDGMTVQTTAEGGIQADDNGAGGTVFEAPQPVMWDSGTATAPAAKSKSAGATATSAAGTADAAAGPGEGAQVAPVGVEVTSDGSELVLTPDQGLLQSAHYPVYIDPQWYSPKATSWTMVSRYWASSPQWKFNGESDAGVGYCSGDSRCAPEDLKRIFFQVPTSKFAGKNILSAEFVAHETHSYSCDARNVELWRTNSISSSTTWNSQLASGFWIDKLQTVNTAHGYTDCAAGDIEFSALRAVQQASSNGWSTTTFGLKATDEGDPYSWKRFSDDAYLRVEYNRPPKQISDSQLTTDPGGACGTNAKLPKRVRILPELTANNVTDPDGDTVSVQFGASWDTGDGKGMTTRWTSARSTAKKSGSDFAINMPSSTPVNKLIGWYVRAYDGAEWSPWSHDGAATTCALVYDTSVPAGPAVTSEQYPRSDPNNLDDPWVDGVGRYGTFTIAPSDPKNTDIVKYWYGLNGDPTSAHTLTTVGGAAQTTQVMPAKSGVNYVTAQAFDAAGNGSDVRTYQFRVRAGQPPRLSMGLDEPAGSSTVSGTGGEWDADLHGGAQPGDPGVTGKGLTLDGVDDYAATASPVTNTAKSFSVSAWAKLPSTEPAKTVTALSESGQYSSGFQLYYSPATGGWVFARFTSDNAAGQGLVRATQPSCAAGDTACKAARLGSWTQVTGVFDNTADVIKLYVNGLLVATTALTTTPWDARGQMLIGASAQNGVLSGFFSGELDEAQFFDYQLTDAQVSRLAAKQPVDTFRPAKAIWSFEDTPAAAVGTTVTTVVGRAQQVTANLTGSPILGNAGVDKTSVNFDGVDDYAKTTQPVLDTYQSFAVSFWARAANEDRVGVAVHQAGVANRGFEIYHNATGWAFQRATSDTADATLVRAQQNACPAGQPTCTAARLGQWTHVVAVYDLDIGWLRLYVDGVQVALAQFTTPWLATGPITLGASNYPTGIANRFKGDLDDVQFYDRALSPDEVITLFRQHPVVKGRWKFESASGSPATSPDATAAGNRPATLYNGASIGEGSVDSGALNLNGVNAYAATGSVPIDTSLSFTVSAWAFATAGRPTKTEAVLSQEGAVNSAFTVQYVPNAASPQNGHWEIVMPSADVHSDPTKPPPPVATAANALYDAYSHSSWNHLALVYDAFAGQMRLYVNGELQQTVCADTDGDGTPDDAACTDIVSWASNAVGFNATKSLQFGRTKSDGGWGEYWSGSIDDVWAFQGVLSQAQVQYLASGNSGIDTVVPIDG